MKKGLTNDEVRRNALVAGASITGALFTFEALDRLWNYSPYKNAVRGLRDIFRRE